MSVENISLFNSVLDEALERLGKKNLKLKECQYETVKAVVVDRKDTICILPTGYGKSLIYQLLPYCGLLNLFICNACAVRATYSFLYVDHGLSQSLRFLPKGSQARERDCQVPRGGTKTEWVNLVPRLLSTLPVPSRCERTLVLSGHVISQILGYRVICHLGGCVRLTVCFSIRVCLSRVRLLNELYGSARLGKWFVRLPTLTRTRITGRTRIGFFFAPVYSER